EQVKLSELYYRLGTRTSKPELIAKAIAAVQDLAVRAPQDPAVVYAQAMLAHTDNKIEDAETLYRRVLELDQDHPGSLNNLANLLAEKKNDQKAHEEALRLAIHAVELQRSTQFLDTLAAAQSKNHLYREAVDTMNEVIAKDPTQPEWRLN